MFIYDIQDLLECRRNLRVSLHALREAYKEGLRGKDIIYAILKGRIIEHYPERGRVLVLGPSAKSGLPLHVVCDYRNADEDEIVAVTVYVPDRTHWAAHPARRHKSDK